MDGRFLGKIKEVTFGYDSDGRFGLTLELASIGGNCIDWFGVYGNSIRDDRCGQSWIRLMELCTKAKVGQVIELKGIPIEVIYKQNMLSEWRILEEVL